MRIGDSQTLTVQSYPGALTSYDTTYSDGSYGTVHGGEGHGQLDSTGHFEATWVVKPGTPAGTANMDVAANAGAGKSGFGHATFQVGC